jgi:hypothetical protein
MTMTTIKDIFKSHGPEYLQRFADSMPRQHLKVIAAVTNCKTKHYGATIYCCQKCGKRHIFFRSCGNRHCPACQHHKTHQWLNNQIKRQLPGHHFMITFTVPQQLRGFIRSNQRKAYSALFRASSQTMKKLALDPKYIGADLPGFFGVLHTWGRQLQYHPHIHYIVPGGGLSKNDGKWHPSRIDFYLPVRAMSKIFKAKFKDQMKANNLYSQISDQLWQQNFNVDCQPVGNSTRSIKYLAPYVFKVAISDYRIVKLENRLVFFKYKKTGSNRCRTMHLEVMEFIRRYLQHVLPAGFMKIRYYGFLNPNCCVCLSKISVLIQLAYGFWVRLPFTTIVPKKIPTCPTCGANLLYHSSINPRWMTTAGAG